MEDVLDALEGKKYGCLIGEPASALPNLAPPPGRAPPRPDSPVVCPGLDSTGLFQSFSFHGVIFHDVSPNIEEILRPTNFSRVFLGHMRSGSKGHL